MEDLVQRFRVFAEDLDALSIEGKENLLVKDGGWTLGQIVHHITDATLMYLSRVILVLSNDSPTLVPFDQDMLASYSFNSKSDSILPIELPLLKSLCAKFAYVLESLSIEHAHKTGFHPEIGQVTLKDLAKKCIEHNEIHLKQIQSKLGS